MDPELIPNWMASLQAQRGEHKRMVSSNREEISNLKRKLGSLANVKNDMEKDGKDISLLQSEFIDEYQSEVDRLESENKKHIAMSNTIDSILESM